MNDILGRLLGAVAGRGRRALVVGSLLLGAAPLGCAGSAQLRAGVLYEQPVYYVDAPPPHVYRYPSAHYHGRPAYLVDGRWYYSSPGGWVVFREEPRELRVYRQRRIVNNRHERHAPRREVVTPRERRARPPYATREQPTERRRRTIDHD